MPIHPTAIVDRTSEIDPSADIGACAIIERGVRIGPETHIYPHAYISQGTTIGRRCQIHPFAVIGHLPQDLKFEGQDSYTRIGDETVVREHAAVHRGTMPGSTTVVGQRCYIMCTGHIAHNCVLGDDVKLAGLLAGHVEVGSGTFVSAHSGIHQFARIGELAMIGYGTRVPKDVPSFMLVAPAGVVGINVIGLRRAGFGSAERLELRECHRILYRSDLAFPAAIERVAQMVRTDPGRRLVEFLRAPSKRGFQRLKRQGGSEADEEDELM
jgi:UDP-N-acetylglucosamine acyltransferase